MKLFKNLKWVLFKRRCMKKALCELDSRRTPMEREQNYFIQQLILIYGDMALDKVAELDRQMIPLDDGRRVLPVFDSFYAESVKCKMKSFYGLKLVPITYVVSMITDLKFSKGNPPLAIVQSD